MKGRAVLLVLSVLVAAVGTGLIYAYVRSADNRAVEGQRTVLVIVAGADLPRGASIGSVSPQEENRRADSLADDALAGPDGTKQLAELTRAGSTALVSISKGMPLLARYFAKPGSSTVSSGNQTNVLITLQVEGAAAGVGLLKEGQPTMVFITTKAKQSQTAVLLQRATVISINGVSGSSEGASSDAAPEGGQGTIGLSVPIKDAQKVILANENKDQFSLYFGLPGSKSPEVAPLSVSQLRESVNS